MGLYSSAPVAMTAAPCSISVIPRHDFTLVTKLPTYPVTSRMLAESYTCTDGCLYTCLVRSCRNACTSMPSSVRCSLRATPPRSASRSTRCTWCPWLAMLSAVVMPATPPPTTSAALFTGRSNSCSGSRWRTRATDMRMMSLAFSVANSFSLAWTQENVFADVGHLQVVLVDAGLPQRVPEQRLQRPRRAGR